MKVYSHRRLKPSKNPSFRIGSELAMITSSPPKYTDTTATPGDETLNTVRPTNRQPESLVSVGRKL